MVRVREPVKEFTPHGRELFSCEMQGELFKEAFDMGFDMEDFARRFMNSELCAEMDMEYSRYQTDDPKYTLSCLLDEISPAKAEGEKHYCRSDVEAIGNLYRHIQCHTGFPSAAIYERLPFGRMYEMCGNACFETNEYYMEAIEEEGLLE